VELQQKKSRSRAAQSRMKNELAEIFVSRSVKGELQAEAREDEKN